MSSNGSASPGVSTCCSSTTLLGAVATSFAFCFVLLLVFLCLRFLLLQRRRRSALLLQEQQPKLGLDAAAIALLPSFAYHRADGMSASAECSVCLNVVEEEEMVRQLPSCNHLFHQECIDVWLASNASCPVCRGKPEPVRAEETVPSASMLSSAYVVPVELCGDEMVASPSMSEEKDALGEIETWRGNSSFAPAVNIMSQAPDLIRTLQCQNHHIMS